MRFAIAVAVLVSGLIGCGDGGGTRSVTGPQLATPSPTPAAVRAFTVTGTVTEPRVGPVAGATVTARPNFPPGHGTTTTTTNAAGEYRIAGLTEQVIIDVEKQGYENAGYGAFTGDRTLDLVLHRALQIDAGMALDATIWGDDDFWDEDFGNRCHTPQVCRLVQVRTTGAGMLSAQLSPVNPVYALTFFLHVPGLASRSYFPVEIPGSGGTLGVSGQVPYPGTYWIVVQFVTPPGPAASQEFEVETQFVSQ